MAARASPTAPSRPDERRPPVPAAATRSRPTSRRWRRPASTPCAPTPAPPALAARARAAARPVGDGRAALGAARRLPRRARPRAARSRPACASRPRAAPATRRCSATRSETRSRRRSCAGTAAAGSSGSSSGCATRCATRTAGGLVTYVELPEHRVPAAAVRRLRLVQRLPGRPGRRPPLPRAAPEPGRRPAAAAGRAGARQPQPRARAAGGPCRLAGRRRIRGGCAGTFVFAWTDEWHRGDDEVLDWDFGLTDRERRPKPALAALRRAYATRRPARSPSDCPRVSVVVCTYNGAATLGALPRRARRPSTTPLRGDRRRRRLDRRDRRASPRASDVRRDPHREPRPERGPQRGPGGRPRRDRRLHRRRRLARPATGCASWPRRSRPDAHAAVGGPNLPPPTTGAVAACVANAPGRPDPRAGVATPRPSTSPAATWPSAGTRCWRSAASTRSSAWPATTSTSAGGCRSGAGRWLPPGGARLAPPPQHASRGYLAAAARLRQGRGAARAQVAGAVQPPRPRDLGRAHLRPRQRQPACGRLADLPRRLGHRRVPARGAAARHPPDASWPRTPEWYILLAGLGLLASMALVLPWLVWVLVPLAGASAISIWGAAAWRRPSGSLRPPHEPRRPAGITRADRVATPDATGRAAGGPAVAGARAVAPESRQRPAPTGASCGTTGRDVALRPRPGGQRGGVRADAGRPLPTRRRLRPLGSRDPRRGVRRGQAAPDDRGPRPRPAAGAVPHLAGAAAAALAWKALGLTRSRPAGARASLAAAASGARCWSRWWRSPCGSAGSRWPRPSAALRGGGEAAVGPGRRRCAGDARLAVPTGPEAE